MHAVVDKSRCRLYETWSTREQGGRWTAGSGATWSLTSNALRRDGWTSADAAGLPILPGLLRWNEVRNGYVDLPDIARDNILEPFLWSAVCGVAKDRMQFILRCGPKLFPHLHVRCGISDIQRREGILEGYTDVQDDCAIGKT